MPDEEKMKHLELIQGVITRMASNSFVLKGWSVTLATALFGFSAKESEPSLALLALLPIAVFWGLDGYYLALERKFRILYQEAVDGKTAKFNLTPGELGPGDWWGAVWRPAVWGLHLPLAIAALGVSALLCRCW